MLLGTREGSVKAARSQDQDSHVTTGTVAGPRHWSWAGLDSLASGNATAWSGKIGIENPRAGRYVADAGVSSHPWTRHKWVCKSTQQQLSAPARTERRVDSCQGQTCCFRASRVRDAVGPPSAVCLPKSPSLTSRVFPSTPAIGSGRWPTSWSVMGHGNYVMGKPAPVACWLWCLRAGPLRMRLGISRTIPIQEL